MMKKRTAAQTITGILFFPLLLLAAAGSAHAGEDMLETAGRLRMELALGYGMGMSYVPFGFILATEEIVELSGGGGLGLNAAVGLGLSSRLEIDITGGYQTSRFTKDVTNGEGTFTRQYVLGTLKFKIPIKPTGDLYPSQIKFGAGMGYYSGGRLDNEYTPLGGGITEYMTMEYKKATGYHATAELESFITDDLSLVLSLRYYQVSYEIETATYNGALYPITLLLPDIQDFNGNGIDFYMGLAMYFW